MNAIPPAYETLFPPGPVASRAQPLQLKHPGGAYTARIIRVDSNDLTRHPPESYLSASELNEAALFRFPPRRNTFLLGRLAAKAAVGAYMAETDWIRIQLSHGIFGQPVVSHPTHNVADISLSHSGGQSVAIVHPRECPLAVDLEIVDRDRAATVKNELRFRPAETQWLQSAGVEESAAYVMLWTVREALGKAMRCGITCPLELLAVDPIKPISKGLWECRYPNFPQYKCLSWIRADQVLSLALPRDLSLTAGA